MPFYSLLHVPALYALQDGAHTTVKEEAVSDTLEGFQYNDLYFGQTSLTMPFIPLESLLVSLSECDPVCEEGWVGTGRARQQSATKGLVVVALFQEKLQADLQPSSPFADFVLTWIRFRESSPVAVFSSVGFSKENAGAPA